MNAPLPDASPLTDDLDDLTLHEPMTKESDMNEARASERADLTTERILEIAVQSQNEVLVKFPGCASLQTVDEVRADPPLVCMLETFVRHVQAELSRASATALEPADTRAVMDECSGLVDDLICAVQEDASAHYNGAGRHNYNREKAALIDHMQHLASRASPSQPAATASRTVGEQELQEVERLRTALSFYADQSRYEGPNQRLTEPDAWSEHVGLKAYRLDVTRDHGVIAAEALAGVSPPPQQEGAKCVCELSKLSICPEFVEGHMNIPSACNRPRQEGRDRPVCGHSRACHADEVKPANKEDGKQ